MFSIFTRIQAGKEIYENLVEMNPDDAKKSYEDLPDEEKKAYLSYISVRDNLDIVKTVTPFGAVAAVLVGGSAYLGHRHGSK
jgi:Mg/Co/Ni transporter MgtE